MLQLLFQMPIPDLHYEEDSFRHWQKIIGFDSIWDLNENELPKFLNASNLVCK